MIIELTEEMTRAGVGLKLLAIIERDYVVRRRAVPYERHGTVGGRQYLDPGPEALCAGCDRIRNVHGGAKALGKCPDTFGVDAPRFRLREEDKKRA